MVTKIYKRKFKPDFSCIQIRLRPMEKRKLKVLCADLGISTQEFIIRLLKARTDGIFAPPKDEELPVWVRLRAVEQQKLREQAELERKVLSQQLELERIKAQKIELRKNELRNELMRDERKRKEMLGEDYDSGPKSGELISVEEEDTEKQEIDRHSRVVAHSEELSKQSEQLPEPYEELSEGRERLAFTGGIRPKLLGKLPELEPGDMPGGEGEWEQEEESGEQS